MVGLHLIQWKTPIQFLSYIYIIFTARSLATYLLPRALITKMKLITFYAVEGKLTTYKTVDVFSI